MDLGRCLDHTSMTRDTIWMPTVTSGFWLTGGMKERLGLEEFNLTIWQQDGAKPHQVNIVDYLDGIFGKRMLALKSR